eukprot:Seg2271.1 transcript_id=Seg2271.1/GoldUCD/mRNA.D3Y31 product="hypothetical protein" protein_id=Seg2271.1/GoldUCD/D3Y31
MEKMEQPYENCRPFRSSDCMQDQGKQQQAYDEDTGYVCMAQLQLPLEEKVNRTEISDLEIEHEEETYVQMGELTQAVLDGDCMQDQRKQPAYDEDSGYVCMGQLPQGKKVNRTDIGDLETEKETYVQMGELKQAVLDGDCMQDQRKQPANDEDSGYVCMGQLPQGKKVNRTDIGDLETEKETYVHMGELKQAVLDGDCIQDQRKQPANDEDSGYVCMGQLPQGKKVNRTDIGDLETEKETYVQMGELKQAVLDGDCMQDQRKQPAYDEDSGYVCMGQLPQGKKVNRTEIGDLETEKETYVHMGELKQVDPAANSNGTAHEQDTNNNEEKLFFSAKDIEEKWSKVCEKTNQNLNDTVGATLSGQNIVLQRMSSQEAARVRKIAAFAGYLQKKKQVLWGHKWENIYAVVFTNLMLIYKTELDAKPIQVIVLDGYDIAVDEKPGKTGFQLVPTLLHSMARPIQTFRCDKTDLEVWMRTLHWENKNERKLSKKPDAGHSKVASNFSSFVSNKELLADEALSAQEKYAYVVTDKERWKRTKQLLPNADSLDSVTNIYDVCCQMSNSCLPPMSEKGTEKRKCLTVSNGQLLYENTPLRASPHRTRLPLPERKPKAFTV